MNTLLTVRGRQAVVLLALVATGALLAPAAGRAAPAEPAAPGEGVSQPAQQEPRLAVPRPTGRHAVGAKRFELTDTSRRDPWVPESGARHVVVTMHYPAKASSGRPARYLKAAESAAFLESQGKQLPALRDLPPRLLTTVDTHSTAGAEPARKAGGRPLVLLSPGFSLPAATLTGFATDLASRGYVVASLDHPYESSGLQLGSGLVMCVACDTDDYAKVARGRAKDAAFVERRLLAHGSSWRGLIDPQRIGMAGHSIGGNTAAVAGARVKAAINLDGTMFAPLRRPHRPLMLLGSPQHRPGGEDTTWDRDWGRHTGKGVWATVERTGHLSFTDLPVLAGQLGIDDGSLAGPRVQRITRATIDAFFDRHLRHRTPRQPAFPELTVHAGRF